MLLGHWIVSTIRARKADRYQRETAEAEQRRLEREWAKRAARATIVRPIPDPRTLPPGAVVDSTNAVNPRIPIWHGPSPSLRRLRLPPS
jgi:hypothetical protein